VVPPTGSTSEVWGWITGLEFTPDHGQLLGKLKRLARSLFSLRHRSLSTSGARAISRVHQ